MVFPMRYIQIYWLYEQPDDGPLTRPKLVVVYYVVLHII